MEETLESPSGNASKKSNITVVPKAAANETTFRLMITGSDDVIPAIARDIKERIMIDKKIKHLKIHYAAVLNEDIAKKLAPVGLHAVVLCVDAAKSTTLPNMQQTLKHLDFDLLSTALFILNEVQPQAQLFPTVVDAIEKLALTYNIRVINFISSDIKSLRFAVSRVSTVALRSARFIFGHNTPIFKNIDFSQLQDI